MNGGGMWRRESHSVTWRFALARITLHAVSQCKPNSTNTSSVRSRRRLSVSSGLDTTITYMS